MTLACAALCCAATLHAQAFRASIIGRVTDSTDAAVPEAKIRIVRSETNESAETVADGQGRFSFAFLTQPSQLGTFAARKSFVFSKG